MKNNSHLKQYTREVILERILLLYFSRLASLSSRIATYNMCRSRLDCAFYVHYPFNHRKTTNNIETILRIILKKCGHIIGAL